MLQTDYQGLGTPGKHAYLVGKAEGRSVLDIVQAARQLDRKIGKRYLIAGPLPGRAVGAVRRGRGRRAGPRS